MINKNVEQELDFMPMDNDEDDCVSEVPSIQEMMQEGNQKKQEFIQKMTALEKLETSLPSVHGLETHAESMEEIHRKALESYTDLMEVAMGAGDIAASRMLESAVQFLKIGMDAKNSIAEKHLKTIEVLLKKSKFDQELLAAQGGGSGESGTIMDRNALLAEIKKAQK